MKLRIRNSYKDGRPASLEEQANIMAYNCWQIALAGAKNLHQHDYVYDSDVQRIAVIEEYLVFLVHIADRLSHSHLTEQARETFISGLARDTAKQLQRNTEEISGAGDYQTPYFDLISRRMPQYARGSFADGEAGFSLLRTFGEQIKDSMGPSHINKWIVDQIMQSDAPMMIEKMTQSFNQLILQSDLATGKSSVQLLLDE